MELTRRPRRLRKNAAIRDLVHETDVRVTDLIAPVFCSGRSAEKGGCFFHAGDLSVFDRYLADTFERSMGQRSAFP